MPSLAEVARETVAIIERGSYVAPSGRTVSLGEQIAAAVGGTRLYRPSDLDAMMAAPTAAGHRHVGVVRVEVTAETTAEAARRLVEAEGLPRIVALNFASATHPGGGFLTGARAQEEDLARCSALYACLLPQPRYYEANLGCGSPLYTDHIIHSPAVPFFRDDQLRLLEAPFSTSVITAPAPNAGEVLRGEPAAAPAVHDALRARAGRVLAVAADRGDRALVLGAWGCGVFRNDPGQVAEVFASWLSSDRFRGLFDRVAFAVHDRSRGRPVLRAFLERFA